MPVYTKDIAYFYADSKLVMVATHADRHYIINHTLGELEQLLDPSQFYRLNRKTMLNLEAIKNLEMGKNYKWRCHLNPTPSFDVPIPTDKLSDFKEWVNG